MTTWALHTELDLDEVNLHLGALEEAGLLGIVEEDGRATVYLCDRAPDLPLRGRWEAVPDQDWDALWKQGLEPVTVGRVTIAPGWTDRPADHDGLWVTIDPGQAFGTGHHETTALCLGALQEVELTGRRLLDVGSGSGVLGITAALLGASVQAVDVDPQAVETTIENAARNGAQLQVWAGSLSGVSGRFDVVVANLDTSAIAELAAELAARVEPDGVLLASGVSLQRQHEAVTALEGVGFGVEARAGDEWVLLTCRSPTSRPREVPGP